MQIMLETFAKKCNYVFMKKKSYFNLDKYISLFRALGDSNRMAIFNRICCCSQEGETQSNVKEVSTCCDLDLSVVSRHLSILREAGVLNARKDGKEVFYSINTKELATHLRQLADYLDSCDCEKTKE